MKKNLFERLFIMQLAPLTPTSLSMFLLSTRAGLKIEMKENEVSRAAELQMYGNKKEARALSHALDLI